MRMVYEQKHIIRFWNKIDKDFNTNCWNWTGNKAKGYGKLKIFNKCVSAHRFSYIINKGIIPEGLIIMHSCDNRACVNPEHLSIGTYQNNAIDMVNKGRHKNRNSNKTHCSRGHEYTEENTYTYKNNRTCKICIKIRQCL